jgi:hypothetical protein
MTQAGGKPVAPTIALGLRMSTADGDSNWTGSSIQKNDQQSANYLHSVNGFSTGVN